MQGIRDLTVRCHAEVPQEDLPRCPRQEGAAVFALVPVHAIRALVPGVSKFAVAAKGAKY